MTSTFIGKKAMDFSNFRTTGSAYTQCLGYYVTPTFLDALRKSGIKSLEKGWSDQVAKYLSFDALLEACASDDLVTTFFGKLKLKAEHHQSLLDFLRNGYSENPLHLWDTVGIQEDITRRIANMRERLNNQEEDTYSLSEGNTHIWVDAVLFVSVENITQLVNNPSDARSFYRNCLESCVHGLNSPQILCSRLYEQFVSFS